MATGHAEASSSSNTQIQPVTGAPENTAEGGSYENVDETLAGRSSAAGHDSDGNVEETLTESDAGSTEGSLTFSIPPPPRQIPENWTVPQAIERLLALRARITFTDQQIADLFRGLGPPPRRPHEDTSLTRRLASLQSLSESLAVFLQTIPVEGRDRDEIRDIINGLELRITTVQAALDELATRLERTQDPNLGEKLRQSLTLWASQVFQEALHLEERMLAFTRRLSGIPISNAEAGARREKDSG
jgi:hypothetical protein